MAVSLLGIRCCFTSIALNSQVDYVLQSVIKREANVFDDSVCP